MVSHSVYRPRPAGQIEESNTTASRFLGSVRRNWMPASQNAPVAHGLQASDGRAGKRSKSQTVPRPAAPNFAPADSVRSGPEVTLLSPVTPGSSLPAAPQQTSQVTANEPSDPPPAALPSPVPSTDSHPSPVVCHNVTASTSGTAPPASDSPAVVAQPVDSYTATPSQPSNQPENGQVQRQDTAAAITALSSEPVLSSEPQRATPAQAPLHVATDRDQVSSPAAGQSSYQSPSGPSTVLSHLQVSQPTDGRQPLQLVVPNPRAQPSGLILPNDDIWKQWKARLEQLKAEVGNPRLSPIISARVALLDEALAKGDLLYIVLHQVYCRRAVDARILSEFPTLQREHGLSGVDKLSDMLYDNAQLPRHIVWGFADFPCKLENLRHEAWFLERINQISRLSHSLSTYLFKRTKKVAQAMNSRGYPPLVEEMLTEFQVGSPVLLGVIFRSICRNLYSDDKLPKLDRLFQKDLTITAMFMHSQDMQQRESALKQQMINCLVEEYMKIPMKIPMTVGPRSPSPSSFHPAFPGIQTQAMRTHVTGPSSAGSQPSVASPAISTFAQTPTTSNSPQAMMVQSPGYFQHPYVHPSQQQQQQPQPQPQRQSQSQSQQHQLYLMQQQQQQVQMQMQPPQQWQATLIGSFHPALSPQGQSTLSPPTQPVPQRQAQPGYAGQTPQSAQRDQAQYAIAAQSRPSISYATPPGIPSQHPPAHWPVQVAQQQGPQPSDSSQVNMPVQRRASQMPTIQTPHGQFREQTTAPLHQVPSPATQGLSVRYPQPSGPLFPPANYQAPITVGPNPMRLGIHQADLRDPVKKLVQRGPQGDWLEAELYHFQSDFLLAPQPIDPDALSYNWSFTVSQDDWNMFPILHESGQGKRPVRVFQPGSLLVRLRSITLCGFEEKDSGHLWPTKGTTWPSVFYIHVNGIELFVRRKIHNGKDLPLDITKHLRPGENKVAVHFLLDANECKNVKYFFGIERMVTSTFEHARGTVGMMPADETRRLIHDRLAPLVNDDDVAFITDNITISLTDPFTALALKVPVRSINCTHLECFDLETYLRTRKSESGPTPFFDNWRCPICDNDARPHCLRVDNFLVDVLDELARTQSLEVAKAIQVKADGTWALKTVQDSLSVSPHPSRAGSVAAKRKANGTPDTGPEASRPKTESTPDRIPNGHPHERLVIEID